MKRAALLALAALVIYAALALPNHPGMVRWSVLNEWPLELPVLLLAMVAIGRRFGITYGVAGIVLVAIVVKLADYAMFSAFDRPFNALLDTFLIGSGLTLLRDSIGIVPTIASVVGVVLALIAVLVVLERSLRVWANLRPTGSLRVGAAVVAMAGAAWAAVDAAYHLDGVRLAESPPGSAYTTRVVVRRGMEMQRAATEFAAFVEDARNDPYADRSGWLDALDGRDVILIWIESYGRASFDNPLYAPTHMATLETAEAEIASTGMAMKSGWLTSPTAGGQSWLAHGTLASGLWTSDNGRYKAMLASGHKWLFHFAQGAGYRTAAIMPAITLAWPESLSMGFDLVAPAADIPYKGQPFRWVTMPDQFTLAAYPALLTPDARPSFVQIALISSHAPWTPIADMVPWEAVGDGSVFDEMAARGPAPRDLWRDRDAVRDAYRRSVDYALTATFSHVARLGTAAPLVIVAGDHQPAGFVAGSGNKDVPVHMIGPPETIACIEGWGWTDGLVPAPDGPVRRMDTFRNAFLDAFTRPRSPQVAER